MPATLDTSLAAFAATRASTPPPNPGPAPAPAPREPFAEPRIPAGVGTAISTQRPPVISRLAAIAAAIPSSKTPAGRGAETSGSSSSASSARALANVAKHRRSSPSRSALSSTTVSSTAVITTTFEALMVSERTTAYSRARSAGTSWFTVNTSASR